MTAVRSSHAVRLPGWSETIVWGHSDGLINSSGPFLITAEPAFNHKVRSYLLVASCLVSSVEGSFPIRILNVTDEMISVDENELVGKIEDVSLSADNVIAAVNSDPDF